MIATTSLIEAFEFNGNANGVRGTAGIENNIEYANDQFGLGLKCVKITNSNILINNVYFINEFTISFKIKILSYETTDTGGNANSPVVFCYGNGYNTNGVYCQVSLGIIYFVFSNNGHAESVTIRKNILLNNFYELAITYNNAIVKCYIDSILISTKTLSIIPVLGYLPLRIGSYAGGVIYSSKIIDKFYYYSKALSDTDIKRIYEGFSPLNG